MPATHEQLARLERLYEQVLDLDRAGRERWLENLPDSERDLLPMLEKALLQDPLARLTTLPFFQPVDAAGGLRPGQRVGPYELIRRLGKGGMAQVWLARRADGAYERAVALKLPVAALARQDTEQRFARERDILAGLEHPHIARFYDAGVSLEGLPYLALEYVQGKTLLAWCDAHRLSLEDRVRLFLPVLDAVQYSHARGVLHRDLKPSNVMVTDTGEVRLLDFGVARMLEQQDAPLTQVYGRVLTLEYASPEQLNDQNLGPTSDVYSLGVLLYELLTGRLPWRREGNDMPRDPPPVKLPSEQIDAEAAALRGGTPARLAHALRGDLDAIVLKALARDPEQRYRSALAMAQDLDRHLDGEPVLARSDSRAYRLGKFLHRYRASAVATLAILVLCAVAAWQLYLAALRPGPDAASAALASAPAAADAKSIAVLPFVDMSERKDQETFADGLSEEVIDHLAHAADLRVISRTSSFYFKGRQTTIGEIARILGVSHVLEGSVRKSGNQLRVTAQLIRASDGVHLWSQTYDPQMQNVLALQTQIAAAVTNALQATLLGDATGAMDLGGTQDTRAYDDYLRGKRLARTNDNEDNLQARIAAYSAAIAKDPRFAKAYVELADSQIRFAGNYAMGEELGERYRKARAAAQTALDLEPKLGEAHAAMAQVLAEGYLDFPGALAEYTRAVVLSPNNSDVLRLSGQFEVAMGRTSEGVGQVRRAVVLDQFNTQMYRALTYALMNSHRYREAIEASNRGISLDSGDAKAPARRGLALLHLGEYEAARQSCTTPDPNWVSRLCLAIAYDKLHRPADAQAQVAAMQQQWGDSLAYQYAQILAQRGDIAKALDWLDVAYRLPDPGVYWIRQDAFVDPLRKEPRFKALLAALKLDGSMGDGAHAADDDPAPR